MKQIPRTIRVIIVAYLGLLVLALLWVPWASDAYTVAPPYSWMPVMSGGPRSGYRFVLSTSGGGEIQYGQIALEVVVLTAIAGLACFVVTPLGKRRDQS
jgi:hypothetical protein